MNEQAAVTSTGIKELLKSYSWPEAVAEFIWNGFDAGATTVEVSIEYNKAPLDTVTKIAIKDNGSGIPHRLLQGKFRPIYESEKAATTTDPRNHSLPHGKNGKGRLTFFTFSNCAKWQTTCIEDSKYISHEIEIRGDSLDTYSPQNRQSADCGPTGTTITFNEIKQLTKYDVEHALLAHLKNEFAWFLELNRKNNFSILINGGAIVYADLVADKDELIVNDSSPDKRFDIHFVLWNNKLNGEYSKYY